MQNFKCNENHHRFLWNFINTFSLELHFYNNTQFILWIAIVTAPIHQHQKLVYFKSDETNWNVKAFLTMDFLIVNTLLNKMYHKIMLHLFCFKCNEMFYKETTMLKIEQVHFWEFVIRYFLDLNRPLVQIPSVLIVFNASWIPTLSLDDHDLLSFPAEEFYIIALQIEIVKISNKYPIYGSFKSMK